MPIKVSLLVEGSQSEIIVTEVVKVASIADDVTAAYTCISFSKTRAFRAGFTSVTKVAAKSEKMARSIGKILEILKPAPAFLVLPHLQLDGGLAICHTRMRI